MNHRQPIGHLTPGDVDKHWKRIEAQWMARIPLRATFASAARGCVGLCARHGGSPDDIHRILIPLKAPAMRGTEFLWDRIKRKSLRCAGDMFK